MPLVLALKDRLPKDYITRTYYDDYTAGKNGEYGACGRTHQTLANISALRPLDEDRSRFGEYCRTLEMHYREIGRLPAREAGILMRSILTNK
jgi:hypothetical protein